MYTTNTKAGFSAARRIPAPGMVASTFVPGMANRFVSVGGGRRWESGNGRHVSKAHVLGAYRERNSGTRIPKTQAIQVNSGLGI